tara:strand:- start:528 stop:1193 length:666 start_codon:yes stop_codon:yes gene_type:complete
MVEPVTAVLSGIALVRSATTFIKDNISTCQDIGGIAKQIDQLFAGQQEIEKQRIKDSNSNITEQLGISTVAQSVIDAKIAQEQLMEIRTLVNMRFGPNTWTEILTERKRRLDEIKERKRKIKQAKIKRQKEQMQMLKTASIGITVVLVIVFLFAIVYVSFAEEIDTAECMVFKPKYYMICMNEGHEYALIEQQLDILEYKKTHIIVKENPNGIDSTNRTCN